MFGARYLAQRRSLQPTDYAELWTAMQTCLSSGDAVDDGAFSTRLTDMALQVKKEQNVHRGGRLDYNMCGRDLCARMTEKVNLEGGVFDTHERCHLAPGHLHAARPARHHQRRTPPAATARIETK